MAVTERFSEQVKKIQEGRSGQMIASLITQERTQKLDLLIHLITNLKQSLIICGPKGIGKTTLLSIFQTRTADIWPIVYLSATELLRFEKIQEHLLYGLTPSTGGNVAQNLNTILRGLEKLNRRVVLIIDDAALLIPGLMTTLTEYAATYPTLRLVFALSDDEVAVKRVADAAIDTCHFIEIPALSETQCGEFLQHLSDRLDASEVMADMTDGVAQVNKIPKANPALNEQIFKQTKGIPGKITEALPKLAVDGKPRKLNWWYGLAGISTLLIGFIVANHNPTSEPSNVNPTTQLQPASTASLSIPGQTAPTPPPELTPEEVIAAKQATKPLVPETLSKPDLYKGYTRAREGDSLDDFKDDAQKAVAQDTPEQPVDLKIMPAEPTEPPATVMGSTMPAVPSGLAEADIVIAAPKAESKPTATTQLTTKADKTVNKQPAPVSATPKVLKPSAQPIAETKLTVDAEKQAKLQKQKDLEAKKLADQQAALLLAKKQKADALEKARLKQKVIADKEALKIAESSQQKIILPEYIEPKPAETTKVEAGKDKAKPDSAVKPKNPVPTETKAASSKLVEITKTEVIKEKEKTEVILVKPKNPVIIEAKPIDPAAVAKPKSQSPAETKNPATELKAKAESTKDTKNPLAAAAAPVAEKESNSRVTLQLMSFTQQNLVDDFMRKHSALGSGLRTITINNGGTSKYVVVYGSFDSNAQANAAKHKLPAEFRQSAWPRKM